MSTRHARARIATLAVSLAAIASLGVAAAHAPEGRPTVDVATPLHRTQVVSPSRATTHTSRAGTMRRATIPPTSAAPSPKRTTAKPATARPVEINSYRVCPSHPQPCIDGGALTMYAGHILAGHNYMGWQWLSRVPVGRTVRVTFGPLAGTYRVYGHLRINRQGGSIPAFAGAPALVLQTCEGSGTGFSLLHRI